MAKKFTCRVLGFGFSEMAKDAAKFEAKKLSAGSQRFSSSQNQYQPLTQQHRETMQLPTKKALERQSQGSQGESEVKMGSEFGGLSKISNGGKRLECEDAMKISNAHSDKPNPEEQIKLSEQQLTVLEAVSKGQSVFLTGSAGTGKSYLLDFVVNILKELHGPDSVFVTASTGIAACHLNGMTLRSFSGAPIWATSKSKLLAAVLNNKKTVQRWEKAKALVIDEISMIDGEFFDQLNYVAKQLRQPFEKKGVWGGLQLVVTGDFFQLPPVRPQNPNKFFAFEADCWNKCFDKQIELTHVFRQSDRELVEMLQEIRKGLCSPTTSSKLNNCRRPVTSGESVTTLYPLNADVRRVNDERLKALGQKIFTFTATDTGEEQEKSKLKSGIAPDQIGLCVGAQVMLIKNIGTDIGLVNGAIGQIVQFVRDDEHSRDISPSGHWPKVRFLCGVKMVITPESWSVYDGEVEVARRKQVPLILAWAVTVHKCQGMTLERLETNLCSAFEYGMVYVALSRIKSLDGLRLTGFNPSKIKVHPKVLDFYQKLTSSSTLL